MIHIKIEVNNMNKKTDPQYLCTVYENLIYKRKEKKEAKSVNWPHFVLILIDLFWYIFVVVLCNVSHLHSLFVIITFAVSVTTSHIRRTRTHHISQLIFCDGVDFFLLFGDFTAPYNIICF